MEYSIMQNFREKYRDSLDVKFDDFCCRCFNQEFNNLFIDRPLNKSGGEGNPVTINNALWNYEAKSSFDSKDYMNVNKPSNLFKKINDAVSEGVQNLVIYTWNPLTESQQKKLKKCTSSITLYFRNTKDIELQLLSQQQYGQILNHFSIGKTYADEVAIKVNELRLQKDNAKIIDILESLIFKNKPVTALKVIDQLENVDDTELKIKVKILEAVALKESGKIEKSIQIFETITSFCSSLDMQKVFLNLSEIYLNLNDDKKAKEYFEKAKNIDEQNATYQILEQVFKLEDESYLISDNWGDDLKFTNTRQQVNSLYLKAISTQRAKDNQRFEGLISEAMRFSSQTSVIDLLLLDIEYFLATSDFEEPGRTNLLKEKYTELEKFCLESESNYQKLRLKLIRFKILVLALDSEKPEDSLIINEIYTLIGECYFNRLLENILKFLFYQGVINIQNEKLKIIYYLILNSLYRPTNDFLLLFVAFSWNKIKPEELDILLEKKSDAETILIVENLKRLETQVFVENLITNYDRDFVGFFISLIGDPNLSIKLIEALPIDYKEDQSFIRMLLFRKYQTKNSNQWIEATALLEKLSISDQDLNILVVAQEMAYFIKDFELELKIVDELVKKSSALEFRFIKGMNSYHRKKFFDAYELLSPIIGSLSSTIITEDQRQYILGSYLEVLIQTHNEDENLSSITQLIEICKNISIEDKFELFMKFAEYKQKSNSGIKMELLTGILKQAYILVDEEEIGKFNKMNFTYCLPILLGGEKEPIQEIVLEDCYVQLSDNSWYNINCDLSLDSIKIKYEDERYSLFCGKKIGDDIALKANKYSDNLKTKILRIVKLKSYLEIRGMEHASVLSRIDPDKYGYVIKSENIVESVKKTMSDIAGINPDVIEKFESGEYPFFLLASFAGGVRNALGQVRYTSGYVKSNLGTIDDFNKQFNTIKFAIEYKKPIYVDMSSAFMLIECGLIEILISLSDKIFFPKKFYKYLIDIAKPTNKNTENELSIGYNAKYNSLVPQTYSKDESLKFSKKCLEIAKLIESKTYDSKAEDRIGNAIIEKITSDIVDACLFAQKDNEAVVMTEDPAYLYANSKYTENRLPEYFSTWVLSRFLYDGNYVSWVKYLDAFNTLAGYRHYHLMLSARDLYFTIYGDRKDIKVLGTHNLYKLNLSLVLSEQYTRVDYAIEELTKILSLVLIDNSLFPENKLSIYSKIIPAFLSKSENKKRLSNKLTESIEKNIREYSTSYGFTFNKNSQDFLLLKQVIIDYLEGRILFLQ